MNLRVVFAIFCLAAGSLLTPASAVFAQKPNVLWILTDDQRYDSIQEFNRILHGRDHSELGYVESPNVDRLAKMGTTYINTFCHAPGCAPSRASMHYGRYPFRSGIYEFEYHNNNAEHCRPTLPEQMAVLGYQTLHIGKLGVRIRTIKNGKATKYPIYQTDIDFRLLAREGLADWGKDWIYKLDGKKLNAPLKNVEFFIEQDGKPQFTGPQLEHLDQFKGESKRLDEKFDLLRHYNKKKPKAHGSGLILAGVSPRPAGKTRDGFYSSVFGDFLASPNETFSVGTKQFEGVDTSKPLFCHIGYDFPHTPVLPPIDYRERFQKQTYKVPKLDPNELETMGKQLLKQVRSGFTDHMTDDEKQSMIQDYFAFCAYGDSLVGQAVDSFVAYSESQSKPWMVVYVCGDHGWKLNDHGSVSKFTPWKIDCHNPIIVVSSDKTQFPAGKVVRDFTEFVDIAPTVLAAGKADLNDPKFDYLDGHDLAKVGSGEAPKRDYVVGECHAVTGPRAYIRTKDYVFSLQTRPDKTRGKNMDWAMNASYEELDPALYHMPTDPHETRNLAFAKEHEEVAFRLKEKLLNIVLGDNRVEVNWGEGMNVTGTEVFRSNFAPGAHDGTLE